MFLCVVFCGFELEEKSVKKKKEARNASRPFSNWKNRSGRRKPFCSDVNGGLWSRPLFYFSRGATMGTGRITIRLAIFCLVAPFTSETTIVLPACVEVCGKRGKKASFVRPLYVSGSRWPSAGIWDVVVVGSFWFVPHYTAWCISTERLRVKLLEMALDL